MEASPFHWTAFAYSCADWDCLCDHLSYVLSSAVSEFCDRIVAGIEIYIPHCKYHLKPHISPWFSAACAATIVHKITFFIDTNSIDSL